MFSFVVIIFFLVLFGLLIRTFGRNLSGVWKFAGPNGLEKISLTQMGPLVHGTQKLPGGYHLYKGYFTGSKLVLNRHDFGMAYLQEQGFPTKVAKKLEGSIMARMEFRVFHGNAQLKGQFFPQYIKFIHSPPTILEKCFLKGVKRSWTRE